MCQAQFSVGVIGAHETQKVLACEGGGALAADALELRAAGDDVGERVQDHGGAGNKRDALNVPQFGPGISEVFPARESIRCAAQEHDGTETRARGDELVQEYEMDCETLKIKFQSTVYTTSQIRNSH